MKNIFLLFAAVLFSVALAACGGGGGSAGISPDPENQGPEIQDQELDSRVRTAVESFGDTSLALGKAKKGSVIQSTNKDADGVTKTDFGFEVMRNPNAAADKAAARARFSTLLDYGRFLIRITHEDSDGDGAPDWTVNRPAHYSTGGRYRDALAGFFADSLDSPDASPGAPGSESGDFLNVYAAVAVTIEPPNGFYTRVDTKDDVRRRIAIRNAHFENVAREIDNGDWFAFGYWLYSPKSRWDIDGFPARYATGDFEMGVFADGGKLIEHDISRGAGVAEYTGEAQALLFGDSIYQSLRMEGGITLRSDFGAQKISGNIVLDQKLDTARRYEVRVKLEEADISRGFFRGDLAVESARHSDYGPDEADLLSVRIYAGGGYVKTYRTQPIGGLWTELQNVTGHWGGNFSHSDGPNDVPDFAVGTFGGKDAESGLNLFGTFLSGCTEDCDDIAAPGFTGVD